MSVDASPLGNTFNVGWEVVGGSGVDDSESVIVEECYDTLLISLIVHVPSFTHARDSFLLSPLLMTCPYDASSIMQTLLLIQ